MELSCLALDRWCRLFEPVGQPVPSLANSFSLHNFHDRCVDNSERSLAQRVENRQHYRQSTKRYPCQLASETDPGVLPALGRRRSPIFFYAVFLVSRKSVPSSNCVYNSVQPRPRVFVQFMANRVLRTNASGYY